MVHVQRSMAVVVLFLAGLALFPARFAAQSGGTGIASAPADPQIAAALQEVSAQRIRANIEKLVSFGTRSTISASDKDQLSAGRGIVAARSDGNYRCVCGDEGDRFGEFAAHGAGDRSL
jgi:hypothetical protein